MTEGTVDTPQVSRRKLIERPRLTRLLDESPARIKMLIAPAGYGKTTLARQWLGSEHAATWCVCQRQSQDVAALTASVAVAMGEVMPGLGSRTQHHVRAVEDPSRHVDVLAEMLIEDAAGWPRDTWLVVDDYQELLGVNAAELLIANLAESGSFPVLICSRERPSWATARRILYQEIQEVTQEALALSATEAKAILGSDWNGDEATVDRAGGWPALVGLAALTSNSREFDAELPQTLYDYFADEIYFDLPKKFQSSIQEMSLIPRLSDEIVREIYGDELGDELFALGRRVGIITPAAHGAAWEVHPLLRQYFERKQSDKCLATELFRRKLVEILAKRRGWDEAFAVAEGVGPELEEQIMEEALDDLLRAGRSETLKSWTLRRCSRGLRSAIDSVISAELRFREGYYGEAQHLAVGASEESEGKLKARAYLVAGRAAHLGSREDEALRFCRLAQRASGDPSLKEQAMWAELSAAVDMELNVATELLVRLRGDRRDPDHVINVVTKQMMLESRLGRLGDLDLDPARAVERDVDAVGDPLVRCSFRNTLASALVLRAEYQECLLVCERLESDATKSRLAFVTPYVDSNRVLALVGLRQETEALALHASAYEEARRLRDDHSRLNLEAILARLHFAAGRYDEAWQALVSQPHQAIRSMRGEYLATRALIAAATGRYAEAETLSSQAAAISVSAEPAVLTAGALAISAIRSGSDLARSRTHSLLTVSKKSGNSDCLITVYRGCPEVAGAVTDTEMADSLRELMLLHGDVPLARALEALVSARRDQGSRLSPREREVAELIQRGLSNAEIAAKLFISTATAKVHVHHILEKFGVRSRVEVALRLAAENIHATSAVRESGSTTSSAAVANTNLGPDAIR